MECQQRAAEIHDEALFKTPPPREECPICCLTLPLNGTCQYQACCGQILCNGCFYGSDQHRHRTSSIRYACPFCRTPRKIARTLDGEIDLDLTHKHAVEDLKKRIDLNDANAFFTLGCRYRDGLIGLPVDHAEAFALWSKAAELGHSGSNSAVGHAYYFGRGVGEDKKKSLHHFEIAAMMGDEAARYNIAQQDHSKGNIKRAMKHYLISANAGDDEALKMGSWGFGEGHVTKIEYEQTLRTHKTVSDGMKSHQRDEAAAACV